MYVADNFGVISRSYANKEVLLCYRGRINLDHFAVCEATTDKVLYPYLELLTVREFLETHGFSVTSGLSQYDATQALSQQAPPEWPARPVGSGNADGGNGHTAGAEGGAAGGAEGGATVAPDPRPPATSR